MRIFNLIQKNNWPLYAATATLLISITIPAYHLLQGTGGIFSLPRDEAFLQLSTARNLAFRQTWGISRYYFEAASPSLLYPLALAIPFFLFGPHLVLVVLANTLTALLLLTYVHRWLVTKGIQPLTRLCILLMLILLPPLPLMIMYGMERTLLLFFAFLFISRMSDEWRAASFSRMTLIYGALMVATGYESLLVVAIVCMLLLLQRRWYLAFELGLWAILPVLIFGFIALRKGGYFLPDPYISAIGSQFDADWLIGCGVATTPIRLSRYMTQTKKGTRQWVIALGGIFIIMLFSWNVHAMRELDRNSLGIHKQEYMVGQFLHRYYNRKSILTDDAGMLSYMTEGIFIDLSGQASAKILRHRSDSLFGPGLIRLLNDPGIEIAVVSDKYEYTIPDDWAKVASWQIPGYGLTTEKTIVFYITEPKYAHFMKQFLEEYSYFLPHDVIVRYFYNPPPKLPTE